MYGVVLQFWFWLTPIVYPANILPEGIQWFMQFNPMSSLIAAYQGVVVYGSMPQWWTLWPVTLLGALLCFWGLRLFKKHSGELVDEL